MKYKNVKCPIIKSDHSNKTTWAVTKITKWRKL